LFLVPSTITGDLPAEQRVNSFWGKGNVLQTTIKTPNTLVRLRANYTSASGAHMVFRRRISAKVGTGT
jgi:hypothetical protein